MGTRLTRAAVEARIAQVNRRLGLGGSDYLTPGAYRLGSAYGGWRVERVCNEAGGVEVVSSGGYGSLREAYTFLHGVIVGLDAAAGAR